MGTKLNPGKFDCLANAKPNEPFFVLLARDKTAALVTDMWAEYREREILSGLRPQSDMEQVAEARYCAADMRKWRKDNFPNWRDPQPHSGGIVGAPPDQDSSGIPAGVELPPFPPQQFGAGDRRMPKTLYVCGLCFTVDRQWLLLIQKQRPAWVAGKLNGIGGHVEKGETPEQAMQREGVEEGGADFASVNWQPLCTLTGVDFHVWFFSAFCDAAMNAVDAQRRSFANVSVLNPGDAAGEIRTRSGKTPEMLYLAKCEAVSALPIMDNLATFIPLALDTSGIVKPIHFLDKIPNATKAKA